MEVKEILDLGDPQCGLLALLIGQGFVQRLLQITEDSDFPLGFIWSYCLPCPEQLRQSLGESPRFDALPRSDHSGLRLRQPGPKSEETCRTFGPSDDVRVPT